jgi:hypothetical protein
MSKKKNEIDFFVGCDGDQVVLCCGGGSEIPPFSLYYYASNAAAALYIFIYIKKGLHDVYIIMGIDCIYGARSSYDGQAISK